MPIRLDPFQNIVGVNWGARPLEIPCTFRVDYGGPAFGTTLAWTTQFQMIEPEVSEFVGGETSFRHFGEFYQLASGSNFSIGFHEQSVRPIEGATIKQKDARVRVFAVGPTLPTSCTIRVRFGFGPNADAPVRTVHYFSRDGWTLYPPGWLNYPRDVPILIDTQFQRSKEYGLITPVVRTVSGLPGDVADLGTLLLNFAQGDSSWLPPEPPEPEGP